MRDWVCLYKAAFDYGFQFPFTPLVTEILSLYGISPGQLMPNDWRLLLSLEHFTEKFGIIVDPIIFRKRYYAKEHEKEKGRVLFVCRTRKKPFVTCLTKAGDSDWKKAYCFFRGDGLFDSRVEKSFTFSWQILNFGVQPNTNEFVDRIIEDIESIKEKDRNFRKFLPKNFPQKSQDVIEEGIPELQSLEHIHILLLTREFETFGIKFTILTHMTEEQRMFADKMSQKRTIKFPKASDAMARAKLTIAKKSKIEGSKQVSKSNFTDVPMTPSSLGHVDGILHPADRARLIKLGPTGVANNGVADDYKILQAMLFIQENYPVLEKKNKKLTVDNAILKLENGKYVEIERELEETIKSLKGELEEVKKELIDEKKRTEDLACEAEQVALTAVIKTHGELMIEY
uniref:Transposase (putative) gypsy type domain-containing protein n=1 Tax=Cannabis sativa TaxID=3483 RepID=A0A803NHZ3_CANSA